MRDADIDDLVEAIHLEAIRIVAALKENTAALTRDADSPNPNQPNSWRKFLAEIDDLKAGITALTTAVSDAAAELKAVADALVALKGQNPINPADVEAAAQAASALAANLESAVAATKTEAGV